MRVCPANDRTERTHADGRSRLAHPPSDAVGALRQHLFGALVSLVKKLAPLVKRGTSTFVSVTKVISVKLRGEKYFTRSALIFRLPLRKMTMAVNVFQQRALERARADLFDAQVSADKEKALQAWFKIHRLIQQKHRGESVTQH